MSRVIGKFFIPFVIVAALSGAAFLGPKQAIDPVPVASGLKQYTAGGHVLGFRENGVIIASGSVGIHGRIPSEYAFTNA